MWLLYLLYAAIAIGVVVLLLGALNPSILDYLEQNNNLYLPFHIVLSFYSEFLGDYGKKIRQRSFARLLASENITYTPAIGKLKDKVFADLRKCEGRVTVLEVGAGPGVNFEYYPKNCDVIIVEPVAEFKTSIMEAAKPYEGIRINKFLHVGAEAMKEIENGSVDVVVSSDLLCSVKDAHQVLKEIYRVLKPNGKYYFSEHTLDEPKTLRRKLQDFLMWTGWWPMWMMGCTFIDIPALFKKSDFRNVEGQAVKLQLKEFAASVDMIAPHFLGVATK